MTRRHMAKEIRARRPLNDSFVELNVWFDAYECGALSPSIHQMVINLGPGWVLSSVLVQTFEDGDLVSENVV